MSRCVKERCSNKIWVLLGCQGVSRVSVKTVELKTLGCSRVGLSMGGGSKTRLPVSGPATEIVQERALGRAVLGFRCMGESDKVGSELTGPVKTRHASPVRSRKGERKAGRFCRVLRKTDGLNMGRSGVARPAGPVP